LATNSATGAAHNNCKRDMLPHHHRSGRDNNPTLRESMAAPASGTSASASWWSRRLLLAVLALPVSVPVFVAFQLIAAPVMLVATLITRRNMFWRPLRLLRMAPLDAFWFPFWRLCTKDGRQRCEYVDMSVTGRQPGSIRCPVDGLPTKPSTCARLVLLSDTHGKHDWIDVPNGDVLCHTGDITVGWQNRCCCCRPLAAIRAFDVWLGDLPHRHKVVIGGNHDAALEKFVAQGTFETGGAARPFQNATYLENSGKVLQLPDGGTLHVWGTPWSSPGKSANQAFRACSADMIDPPTGVDLLLSHSKLSRELLERVSPRVHASGHFHNQHGVTIVDDQRHVDATGLMGQTAGVYETCKAFAPPPGLSRRVDVNCAVCDGDYSTTQPVVVVDLPVSSPSDESTLQGRRAATPVADHWKGLGKLLSRITG